MRRVIPASSASVTGGRRVAQSGIGRVTWVFPLRTMVVSPFSKDGTTIGASYPGATTLSHQRIEQRPGILEVGGIKAFGEPAIDLGQQLVGCGALALLLPQATQAHGSS